jgi:hypothetical protein
MKHYFGVVIWKKIRLQKKLQGFELCKAGIGEIGKQTQINKQDDTVQSSTRSQFLESFCCGNLVHFKLEQKNSNLSSLRFDRSTEQK